MGNDIFPGTVYISYCMLRESVLVALSIQVKDLGEPCNLSC